MPFRLLLLIVFSILLNHNSLAQVSSEEFVNIPNLTPPSPTAFQLGTYGQENIGLFTGTAQVDIPLYEYRTVNLKVPIKLAYSSNGILVNQVSSNVGLGWNLIAGGVISRVARDGSDEHNTYFYPEKELKEEGERSPMALDFFYQAGENGIDTETDLFSYNFQGYSGKFVYDNNKKIVQMPKTALKIENYSDGGENVGFIITTPLGVKYIFLEEETSISWVDGGGHSIPELPITTAWYLSRIEHPEGDVIYFNYTGNGFYNYVTSESQTLKVASPDYQSACGYVVSGYSVFPDMNYPLKTWLKHNEKRLVGISSNFPSAGSISFTSNQNHPIGFQMMNFMDIKHENGEVHKSIEFNYLQTSNDRVFLDKVSFPGPGNDYKLSYINPESFPKRLSYSQDHWGYYNGKNNYYLFPNPQTLGEGTHSALLAHDIGADKSPDKNYLIKGMLQKVEYPTKGFTQFLYESNTVWGQKLVDPPTKTKSLSVVSEYMQRGTTSDTHNMIIDEKQEVRIFASVELNPSSDCYNSEQTHDLQAKISILNIDTGTYSYIYKKSTSGSPYGHSQFYTIQSYGEELFANLNETGTYQIKLLVSTECREASAKIYYVEGGPQLVEANIPDGGLRVQKKIIFDGVKNQTERYYYGNKEEFTKSSGKGNIKPYYVSSVTDRRFCLETGYKDFQYLHLNSNSIRKLYKTAGKNSVYYQYVTVSNGGNDFENGGVEHEFEVGEDYFAKPIIGDYVESSPLTNYGWSNGLEKRISTFKKDAAGNFITLYEIKNNYKQDTRLLDEVYAYAVQKKFDWTSTSEIVYNCQPEDYNKVFIERVCEADHNHVWGNKPFDGTDDWVCLRFSAQNTIKETRHPCYYDADGVITHPEFLENLNITEYKSISYWYYLESQIKTTYDVNGENPVQNITNFFYDNPDHLQITREETFDSEGDKIIKEISYAPDIEGVYDLGNEPLTQEQLDAIQKMKWEYLNYTGVPVQTEVSKVTEGNVVKETSVQRTNFKEYSEMILPATIEMAKGSNLLKDRLLYKRYDAKGNPLEINKEKGPPIAYIWGYDGQFPVAKIENATYADIEEVLGPGFSLGGGRLSVVQENSLRTALSNALVTTYTYEPLVGLKTMTDPKGVSTYYEYDQFNRLEFVKDEDGNILKEHKYQYREDLNY